MSNTLTPNTKVPLYVVGSAIGLAVLLCLQWADIRHQLQDLTKDAVTEKQMQEWIENAREVNPQVKWPRLPTKETFFNKEPRVAKIEE